MEAPKICAVGNVGLPHSVQRISTSKVFISNLMISKNRLAKVLLHPNSYDDPNDKQNKKECIYRETTNFVFDSLPCWGICLQFVNEVENVMFVDSCNLKLKYIFTLYEFMDGSCKNIYETKLRNVRN